MADTDRESQAAATKVPLEGARAAGVGGAGTEDEAEVEKKRLAAKEATRRARWAMLRKVVRRSAALQLSANDNAASVRRFKSYGLIKSQSGAFDGDDAERKEAAVKGLRYSTVSYDIPWPQGSITQIKLRQRAEGAAVSLADFAAFNESRVDNTGNVCLWLSEEVLSHIIVTQTDRFAGKSVCELGAGVGLAGFVCATVTTASSIFMNDGNGDVVDALRYNMSRCLTPAQAANVSADILLWSNDLTPEDVNVHGGPFDVIIASDCLFFRDYHDALVHTLKLLLKPSGEALFLAPRRGGSLEKFVALASDVFDIDINEDYDEHVTKAHQDAKRDFPDTYDVDIHFPLLLRFTHKAVA